MRFFGITARWIKISKNPLRATFSVSNRIFLFVSPERSRLRFLRKKERAAAFRNDDLMYSLGGAVVFFVAF